MWSLWRKKVIADSVVTYNSYSFYICTMLFIFNLLFIYVNDRKFVLRKRPRGPLKLIMLSSVSKKKRRKGYFLRHRHGPCGPRLGYQFHKILEKRYTFQESHISISWMNFKGMKFYCSTIFPTILQTFVTFLPHFSQLKIWTFFGIMQVIVVGQWMNICDKGS